MAEHASDEKRVADHLQFNEICISRKIKISDCERCRRLNCIRNVTAADKAKKALKKEECKDFYPDPNMADNGHKVSPTVI